MKSLNKRYLNLASLLILILSSCSGNSTAGLYFQSEQNEIVKKEDIKIYFPKGNDIAYISLEDGVSIASLMRASSYNNDEYKYTINQNNEVATIVDEKGTKAVFDLTKQTVTIENFDSFVLGYEKEGIPLMTADFSSIKKSIKLVKEESSYTKGNEVTLNLNDYPSIKLEKSDNNHGLLIPVAVFNDIFFSGAGGFNGIAYNLNNLYISTGLVSLGNTELTPIGKHYYGSATTKKEVSKEFAQYVYDETTFNLDHFYGLKGIRKISSFKSFIKEKGLEEDLLSGNIEKMEESYATLFYKCLEDGHTAYLAPSFYTDVDDFEVKDTSKSENQIKKALENADMDKEREKNKLNKPFEIIGDTAFIFFDDFMELDENKLYGNITSEDIASNNTLLFAYAYKEIKKHPEVKNVVVDLVTNNGGDATGLIYCLGTLIGKHYIDTMNPLTGSRSHITFQTDINLDGNIDDKDIPLSKDYKIYFLDSKFAYSCGNLFPVAAKYNNPDVTILGDTTGGGTCVVSSIYNGYGAYVIKSGLMMLTKKTAEGYTHIEDGVKADKPIEYEKMFDRNYIVKTIS